MKESPLTGTVSAIAFGGEGIIRSNGKVTFIPLTAIGDEIAYEIIEEKKQFARGRLLSLIRPSPLRIEPQCPYFGNCGGCQFQHLVYPAQLTQKQQFVKDALQRISGIDFPIPPPIPSTSPWNYRKHITLHLRPQSGILRAGYIGGSFLPVTQCPIFISAENPTFANLQSFVAQLELYEGDVRLITTEEGVVLAFSFETPPPSFEKIALSQMFQWRGIALNGQSWGNTSIPFSIGETTFQLSPYSFMQAHRFLAPQLYNDLTRHAQGPRILDLYCGSGLLSILLAQKGYDVIGVESNPTAVQSAVQNGAGLPISFKAARVEKVLSSLLQERWPQTVVVNPPRGGLHPNVIQALQHHGPSTLIYMSCMPPTLARDLKALTRYRLDHIALYDMFPQTTHLEVIARLKLQ